MRSKTATNDAKSLPSCAHAKRARAPQHKTQTQQPRLVSTILKHFLSLYFLSNMITPTPKDLFEAIMTTSADVVENYLQNSSEHTTLLANANLASFLPIWQTIVDSLGHVHPNCIAATNGTPFDSISALHLAILSCVSHETNPTFSEDIRLRIVQTLLSRGANAELETNGIYIAVTGPNRHQKNLAVVENGTTPLQLAVLVKKYMHPPSQPKVMNQVTSLLLSHHHQANNTTNKDSPQQHGTTIPKKTQQVPTSVYHNWNKLLINSEFADVMFECADGKTFVAHKCVLAACSTYFQNYFSGPWSKHHAQGVWKTTNSSPVMWAILKVHVYRSIGCDYCRATACRRISQCQQGIHVGRLVSYQ